MNTVRIPPQQLKFAQDSISARFGNGTPLEKTFQKLLYGEINVDDLIELEVVLGNDVKKLLWQGFNLDDVPNLEVVQENDWVIEGNRRLLVYKELQNLGILNEVPVKPKDLRCHKTRSEFVKKFTTNNQGVSVKIRWDMPDEFGLKLESRLKQIVEQWKLCGKPTNGYKTLDTDFAGAGDPIEEIIKNPSKYIKEDIDDNHDDYYMYEEFDYLYFIN